MNFNFTKRKDNPQYSNTINNKINYNNSNHSGKIIEKFIVINNGNTIPKQKKVKEIENENYIRRQKSNIFFKLSNIPYLKIPKGNEPYLKPKFQRKNKNSFSIKNKKSNVNHNNINEENKNIYLNFFKVYYDENGKKVKIIKNKSNYKENKSKELVLTQNNKDLNNDWVNERNNYKIKKNFTTEFFDKKIINDSIYRDNIIGFKYFSPETPSQSTTTENKSNAKSGKNIKKEEINANFNKKIFMNNNGNNTLKRNIYYDNLPLFLKKKKNVRKNDKKFKKKNLVKKKPLNSTENLPFFNQSLNKLKKLNSDLNKDILIANLNNKEREMKLNNKKNNIKNGSTKSQKINYFHNDISNLTLNMTFEQNNITNAINTENSNIKNIYISSFKKRNVKNENQNVDRLCLDNNFERIKLDNKTINPRHSLGIQGNYFLFNFFKDDHKELNRNKSYGYQNIKNFNSNYNSRESSMKKKSNLSFNKNNIMRNTFKNPSNTFNEKENEISILNKTKEILKIKEDNLNIDSIKAKKILLNNSQSFNEYFPKSFLKIKKNNSYSKTNNNAINEKIISIPNIDYFSNSKILTENNDQNPTSSNLSLINKNKRPCSLYINKKSNIKENKNLSNNSKYFSLNDYYNSAIDKDTHLNTNINNIYINKKYATLHYKKSSKKEQLENELNIDEYDENFDIRNIKKNLYDKKFININQNGSSQLLINKRIKMNNIFKFNRNKCFIDRSSKDSLNYMPSSIKINRTQSKIIK